MGRRKIEIQPLADDRNRTVTFVKRKAGLFKKAHELAVLCQVDLAVIIIGSNNKLYEFLSVDTNELIDVYKKTKIPHESKLPANYGNYQKKKHLTNNSSVIHDDAIDDHDIDSEFDSDTPEPKRQKRSYDSMANAKAASSAKSQLYNQRPHPPTHISLSNVPTFNNYRNNPVIKEEDEEPENVQAGSLGPAKLSQHYRTESVVSNTSGSNSHRPILRVQIPTDSKGNSSESAQTITALDTNLNQANSSGSNVQAHESGPNSLNHSSNSNEGHNPTMPHIATPKFSSFGQFKSPDTRKPITTLPVPVQSKSQTSSPQSATAPGLPVSASFFSGMPQGSPSSQFPPNNAVPTPMLNQVFNQQYQNNEKSDQGAGNPQLSLQINLQNKYRSYHNSMGGGEQTPVSGLPSRYVNDIFPSPSNFYAPQEWPVVASGMTPFHNNMPQYFMNMVPSAPPSGLQQNSNFQPQRANQTLQSAPNNGSAAANAGQPHAYQNYQRNDQFQSPVQYMGPFNTSGQPNAPEKK